MSQMLNDNELLSGYLQGNHSNFETLLERHKAKVFGYILSVVKEKNVAEDIFQDTFIKVINTLNLGNYKDEGKFIHWVMRIAHNLTVDYFRKEGKMPMVNNKTEKDFFETFDIHEDSVERKIVKSQIHGDLKKIIKKLPEDQRRVLIMRYYGDMNFKEISEKTGVSINTALGRMRYALINIRKYAEKNPAVLEF